MNQQSLVKLGLCNSMYLKRQARRGTAQSTAGAAPAGVGEALSRSATAPVSGAATTASTAANAAKEEAQARTAAADKAKAEADKAKAEGERAKAEGERAKAEAEKAKAEAEKAKAEAEKRAAVEKCRRHIAESVSHGRGPGAHWNPHFGHRNATQEAMSLWPVRTLTGEPSGADHTLHVVSPDALASNVRSASWATQLTRDAWPVMCLTSLPDAVSYTGMTPSDAAATTNSPFAPSSVAQCNGEVYVARTRGASGACWVSQTEKKPESPPPATSTRSSEMKCVHHTGPGSKNLFVRTHELPSRPHRVTISSIDPLQRVSPRLEKQMDRTASWCFSRDCTGVAGDRKSHNRMDPSNEPDATRRPSGEKHEDTTSLQEADQQL